MLPLRFCFISFILIRGDIIVMLMRNLQSVNALYLLCGLVLCLILMVQIRQIYDNKLKYNRYLGYKQFMNEISTEMIEVEKSVNKSTSYIHRLNEALLKQHDKKQNNVSQTRIIFPS